MLKKERESNPDLSRLQLFFFEAKLAVEATGLIEVPTRWQKLTKVV